MSRVGFRYDEDAMEASYTVPVYERVWNDSRTSFRSVDTGRTVTRSVRLVDGSRVMFARRSDEGTSSKVVRVVGKGPYEYVYKALKTQINVGGDGAADLVRHFSDDLWANMMGALCDHAIDTMRPA